jgi:hypothetical protein
MGQLLRIAVAHAGGFPAAPTARCSASLLQRDLGRQRRLRCLICLSACIPPPLLFRPVVPMDKAGRMLVQGLPPAVSKSYRTLNALIVTKAKASV